MIESNYFGHTRTGETVTCYTLTNKRDIRVSILNYGAIIHSIQTPDRHNRLGEITIGYDTLDHYEQLNQFFGAFVGRYANRIQNGRFRLDDRVYQVSQNEGVNHLHGGFSGFDRKVWAAETIHEGTEEKLRLTCSSEDGDQGFPGKVDVTLTYELTPKNELILTYGAITDRPTIINLTSHTYFNLTGTPDRDILDHQLRINADQITAIDETLIPTGDFLDVSRTPFDFRSFYAIGERIGQDHPQLNYAKGYDHNFVITPRAGRDIPVASVFDPYSGRQLDFYFTQPGLQFYSGNSLTQGIAGKGGHPFRLRQAFCLEPQHFPDSPNHSHFPTARLNPGQTYSHQLAITFSTTEEDPD